MTLVRERGVAATSLDAVQAAANVGRSQLYHYFDDRDDLLRAVAAKTADTVVARTAGLLANANCLEDIDRWFAATVADGPGECVGGCPLGSLVSQLAEYDEQTRTIIEDAFAKWEEPVIASLTRLQQSGVIRPGVSINDLADFIMAAIQGGLLLAQIRRDPCQLRRALAGARIVLTSSLV